MPRCGWAAWLPRPRCGCPSCRTAASSGPGRVAMWPRGRPGLLCRAKTASQGNWSNSPSSTITRPPPRPSSAGWKMKWTAPSKLRVSARYFAAPSSMVVWPSWPQACILPSWVERWANSLRSWIGSASMSARRPMLRGALPRRRVPTTPVLARPRCTSQPNSASLAATRSDGAVLLEAELRMGMDVAADARQLRLKLEQAGDDRHGRSLGGRRRERLR